MIYGPRMYVMRKLLFMLMMVQFNHTNNNNCNSDRTIIINFFLNKKFF